MKNLVSFVFYLSVLSLFANCSGGFKPQPFEGANGTEEVSSTAPLSQDPSFTDDQPADIDSLSDDDDDSGVDPEMDDSDSDPGADTNPDDGADSNPDDDADTNPGDGADNNPDDGAGNNPGGNNRVCVMDRKQSLLFNGSRVGYGANTTGGMAANAFTMVTNLNDDGAGSLRQAMRNNGPTWIIFDPSLSGGTIRITRPLSNSSGNLTIDARGPNGNMVDITVSPASGESGFIAFFLTGGNTILHGLTVDGENNIAGIYARRGNNYWFDHITVTRSNDEGIGVGQTSAGSASANATTISNYSVFNTAKGIICGANANFTDLLPTGIGFCEITVHNSNLAAKSRNPRFSGNVEGHVFNNFIHSFASGGMEVAGGGIVIAENNVYSALTANNQNGAKAQMANNVNGKSDPNFPSGHVFSSGEMFRDIASAQGSINPTNVTKFPIPYNYQLKDAAMVMNHVLNNAGAANASASLEYCQ